MILGLDPGFNTFGWALIRRDGQRWRVQLAGELTNVDPREPDLSALPIADVWAIEGVEYQGIGSANLFELARLVGVLEREARYRHARAETLKRSRIVAALGCRGGGKEAVKRVVERATGHTFTGKDKGGHQADAAAVALVAGMMRAGKGKGVTQ